MRRSALLPLLALAAPLAATVACKGVDGGQVAAAAITTGLAVAAAGVNRAATGGCWADCPIGTECDEESGACVPLPCRAACPAEHRCVMQDGRETCVFRRGGDVAEGEPDEAQPDAGPPADPCQGLCFPGERCEAAGGVADCVPAPAAPATPP